MEKLPNVDLIEAMRQILCYLGEAETQISTYIAEFERCEPKNFEKIKKEF